MQIITRKEAKEKGLKHYFTNKKCKHGHIDFRYTINGTCFECSNLQSNVWRNENLEKSKSIWTTYRKKNENYHVQRCLNWRQENPDKQAKATSRWRRNNPSASRFYTQKRNAQKLKAIPSWANLEKIKEIYKNCPKGFHVDHIVPLQNDLVCGLHVENNLQYLTKLENLKKHNKFSPNIETCQNK